MEYMKLNKLIGFIGLEAFEFIKKIVPELFDLPFHTSFVCPLFYLLVYAFDTDGDDIKNLGKSILEDRNAIPKLCIIYEGVSKILRDLHAENDGKESLVNKDS